MSQASKRITDAMKKSIQDNLSGMVAKELQEVLVDYEKLQKDHELLESRYDSAEEVIAKKDKQIKELKDQIDKARDLDEEEADIKQSREKLTFDQKIFEVEKEMLELKAVNKCQEQTMKTVQEMFKVPFQNRTLRESAFAIVKNGDSVSTETDYVNGNPVTRSVPIDGGERVEPTHKETEET